MDAPATPVAESLGRAGRIPAVEGFDHCLRRPPLYRSGAFAFHLVVREQAGWRLGLVVPKRHVKSAVDRNALKRRWREAFRRVRASWDGRFGGADLVVRLQSRPADLRAVDAPAMLAQLAARLASRGFGRTP